MPLLFYALGMGMCVAIMGSMRLREGCAWFYRNSLHDVACSAGRSGRDLCGVFAFG